MKLKFVKKVNNILLLREKRARGQMSHLNSQKVMKIGKIFHCKLLRKKGNKAVNQSLIIVCQDNIIHSKQKNQNIGASTTNKYERISKTTYKTMRHKKSY